MYNDRKVNVFQLSLDFSHIATYLFVWAVSAEGLAKLLS